MSDLELTIILGDLAINDFNPKVFEITNTYLIKINDETSQEYYYGENHQIISDSEMRSIFDEFSDKYSHLGLGLLISNSKLLLGLSHLTRRQKLHAISILQNT